MLTLHARTNVPLSSAHTWTPFHHPQLKALWLGLMCRDELSLELRLIIPTSNPWNRRDSYTVTAFPFLPFLSSFIDFHSRAVSSLVWWASSTWWMRPITRGCGTAWTPLTTWGHFWWRLFYFFETSFHASRSLKNGQSSECTPVTSPSKHFRYLTTRYSKAVFPNFYSLGST